MQSHMEVQRVSYLMEVSRLILIYPLLNRLGGGGLLYGKMVGRRGARRIEIPVFGIF